MNHFASLVAKRELFYFLAWREIRVRYKQAALGASWAILQPLLLMILFTVIGGVLSISSEGLPRPIFYYSAALPWTFFSAAISQGANSLVSNANLVRQVYFPRELFPWSAIITAGFDFLMAFVVFVGMMLFYHIEPTWYLLYLPLLVALQVFFMLPVSLIFAGLNVAFRDVGLMIGFLLQIWLYASPVIYSVEAVPARFRTLYLLNPMAGLIDSYRRVLVHGRSPNREGLLIGAAISLFLLVVSYMGFKKAERIFADII